MLKISVITVNYNNIDGLKATIESVVGQSYKNVEYIVIDGGSCDGSEDLIQSHRERFAYAVSEKDKGIYNAMNKGLSASTGDYVIFMNSGDVFFDSNVILTVFKDREVGADVIYGSTICKEGEKGYLQHPLPLDCLVKKKTSPICHQSAFIKGELMRSWGYNEKYKILADYDFFYSCYRQGLRFEKVTKIISIYDKTGFSASPKNYKRKYEERCLINNERPSGIKSFLKVIQGYVSKYIPSVTKKRGTLPLYQPLDTFIQL